ncbi:cyclic nucleotide-binding domain-containing protein [Synechococcus sp. RSCCF101]|uniref:cyclic nucleotide-binding domain-containing protein n=1 Tax=Synechococcus sp. RSCCF101 TaxID=2511069 RepID=UPI001243BA31|nr:cyclic nucleotide-binding domain-containing protein [Synechococcus sp. RSCCF101]QEY32510.1 cyclic nucleotide-binding domain-containing protein [Synechococcus sp. RSCCF101]
MRAQEVEAGATVYRAGDPSHALFLVKRGGVDLITDYPETGEGVDASVHSGGVFGEVELIDGRPRQHSARASEPTLMIVLERDELMDVLFDHPGRSLVIGRSVFDHLRELYSGNTLESDLTRLREEMLDHIRQAVVDHEARVFANPTAKVVMVASAVVLGFLAAGVYWWFHR